MPPPTGRSGVQLTSRLLQGRFIFSCCCWEISSDSPPALHSKMYYASCHLHVRPSLCRMMHGWVRQRNPFSHTSAFSVNVTSRSEQTSTDLWLYAVNKADCWSSTLRMDVKCLLSHGCWMREDHFKSYCRVVCQLKADVLCSFISDYSQNRHLFIAWKTHQFCLCRTETLCF